MLNLSLKLLFVIQLPQKKQYFCCLLRSWRWNRSWYSNKRQTTNYRTISMTLTLILWVTKKRKASTSSTIASSFYVPETLRKCVLKWYHQNLQQPGGERLTATFTTICTTICRCPDIVNQARQLCRTCKVCQKYKTRNTEYGQPPKEAEEMNPWHTVCVDLIGSYSVKARVQQFDNTIKTNEINFFCMTFIDTATQWFEIKEVPLVDQSSARISKLFDEVWLARYPRPHKAIYDN